MPYDKDDKSRSRNRSQRRVDTPEPGAALPEPSLPEPPPAEPAPPAPRSRRSLPDRASQPAGPETVFNPDAELGPPRSGSYGPSNRRRPQPIDVAKVFYTAVLISMLILAVDYLQGGTWFLSRPRPVRSIGSQQAAPAPQPVASQPAEPQGPSALVLGVKGNGVAERELGSSTAYFELDDDGFREKTSWIAPDCAFLAQDSNGNGRIDNATELFGRGDGFPNGYAKLQTLDDNVDLTISPDDAAYARLLLWQDVDSDGFCDEGELKTLADAHIRSISVLYEAFPSHSLGPQPPDVLDGKVAFADGKGGHSRDVVFRISQLHTIYGGEVNLVQEALFLPWLRGYGTVKDLPIAVSENPGLLKLVAELADLRDAAALYARMDELLNCWTGADVIDPAAMRGAFSARKTVILERLTGEPYLQKGTRSRDVHRNALPYLEKAYAHFKVHFFTGLAAQTFWSGKFPDAEYNFNADRIVFPMKGKALAAYLAAVANAISPEELPYLARALEVMKGDTKVPAASLVPLLAPDRQAVFENVDQIVLPPDAPKPPAG